MRDVIYHNPRCSKSRETLALVQSRGVDLEVVEYLRAPPTVEELDGICRLLGMEPLQLIRTKEPRFAELGLKTTDARPRAAWLALMAANPILIERPIVVHRGHAALGRPPEHVLSIL
ncbi:MAG: arsenate reductase (glutaredoxin) [Lentisphaerae bacterium]|nr:arsenate reductase (glutaredoxin) [Lentisphaerota bacterium]